MLYIPIKIYPNRWSVRGCLLRGLFWGALVLSGFLVADEARYRLAVYVLCLGGLGVSLLNGVAVFARQPMLRVMDDHFAVYTSFGYAKIRFKDVATFKSRRGPLGGTLRVVMEKGGAVRFSSGLGRLLYQVTSLNFSKNVAIPGYLIGAEARAVRRMLEKRRQSAVRLEAVGEYGATIMSSAT